MTKEVKVYLLGVLFYFLSGVSSFFYSLDETATSWNEMIAIIFWALMVIGIVFNVIFASMKSNGYKGMPRCLKFFGWGTAGVIDYILLVLTVLMFVILGYVEEANIVISILINLSVLVFQLHFIFTYVTDENYLIMKKFK